MLSNKEKILSVILFFIIFPAIVFAQTPDKKVDKGQINEKIQFLRDYFDSGKGWYSVNPDVENKVSGLLNFLESESIDNILTNLVDSQKVVTSYVTRLPEDIKDSLSVPGYISSQSAKKEVNHIREAYVKEVNKDEIVVPNNILDEAKNELKLIPEGKGMQLFADSVYVFPDSLIIPDVIPDSILNSPDDFNHLVQIDNLRKAYIEKKRLEYNDSIAKSQKNTIVKDYQEQKYQEGLDFRIKQYLDAVKQNNLHVLNDYNQEVIAQVNDTIASVLDDLLTYANYIDTTHVTISNITGGKSDILLQAGPPHYSRVWLKNRQQDSLSVMMKTTSKRNIEMLIDDGVTFSRFKEKQTKAIDFSALKANVNKFNGVDDRFKVETPWEIEGEADLGFTQTYLNNWSSGGQNSITLVFGLDGSADYTSSDKKIKWENNIDIDNAWLKPGKYDSVWQKSTDNIELTSSFGLSANDNNKWYYTVELNFNTQFFRGYTYPRSTYPDPISAFLAPATTYFKLGMEYKPKSDLSILLSPFTIKNVYVRDTSLIDQTDFGVDEDRKAFWEPGINAEVTYKKTFLNSITYETNYTMFINFKAPFKKYDVDWENTFKYKLNNYITMQFLFHLLYDDDDLFAVYDSDGNEIGEKAKWQVKEYFSFGFSYSISHDIRRSHRIH
jgi:hypothetical protein